MGGQADTYYHLISVLFSSGAKALQLTLKMAEVHELACTYAALILTDDEVPITGDKISTILKAANVDCEPIWPTLFAKALSGVDVRGLITNVGSSVGAAPAGGAGAGAPAAAAPAAAAEEKKEEKKKESSDEGSDDDMGFGLFD